ncbi:hypothetical protein FOZ60_004532 [Perkinsus olseni]|uniref:Uncharacterized protein n=1 Tax=Perkinsus olseni TaxID=32597 RepID=A0A7J6PI81_PEROL|nr:hypothetical protein FOZ60_004532 [Perkinsus olseni]
MVVSSSWSHYTPQIGVPTGCRPGPRNNIEAKMLSHMAKQENGGGSSSNGRSRPSRVTESSLPLGSMMPAAGQERDAGGGGRRHVVPKTATTSMLHGSCVPYTLEGKSSHAPSRITESTLWGAAMVEATDDAAAQDNPRNTHDSDLRPPDNLSRGLRAESEVEHRRGKARIQGARAASTTLSPSLVPCLGDHTEEEMLPCDDDHRALASSLNLGSGGKSPPPPPPPPFKRAYGLLHVDRSLPGA